MSGSGAGRASLAERAGSARDAFRRSFGLLAGVVMAIGLVAGFVLPSVDGALDIRIPAFAFTGEDAARSLLETVATATVSVAGLAFSVTVVASSQLSPRVLRTFSADRLSQATLACFLGTFVYCLAVLVRLDSAADEAAIPNLSVTLAVVLGFVSFVLFSVFIAHIVRMLQPSSIIESIHQTGRATMERPYPTGVGDGPVVSAVAARQVAERRAAGPGTLVLARSEGYLSMVRGTKLLTAGEECGGLVVQHAPIGDYVVLGTPLAEVWCADEAGGERLARAVGAAFVLDSQRTPLQDTAFAIRQLADIALKGLSPGINDPTTAENAMDALSALLVRFAAGERPSLLRAAEGGVVRFVALGAGLDDLIRLGFEQVRGYAASDPVLARRLLVLLKRVEDAATIAGTPCSEASRQAALVAEGTRAELSTRSDAAEVQAAWTREWAPPRR